MDLGASSGLLPVGGCSAEMRSSPMSEEFSVGPWSCEGAGHGMGGPCSSLGLAGPSSLCTNSFLSAPQVISVLHQPWLCAVACPCHPRALLF